MDGVIDTTLDVDGAVIALHVAGHQDDIDAGTLLAQIGDGGDVLCAHSTLIEHQEVLVGHMGGAYLGTVLVGIGHADQLARDVLQTFLCLRIAA